jgi:hypothetical protein
MGKVRYNLISLRNLIEGNFTQSPWQYLINHTRQASCSSDLGQIGSVADLDQRAHVSVG